MADTTKREIHSENVKNAPSTNKHAIAVHVPSAMTTDRALGQPTVQPIRPS